MSDLKLTNDNDLDLTNGSLSFVEDLEAHAQRIKMHYLTFLGESRYDRSAGVPWIQVILSRSLPPESVRMILDLYGRAIPGVVSTSLAMTYDRQTRKLTVTGSIETIEGPVDFVNEPIFTEVVG